jgi:hypothetical protein
MLVRSVVMMGMIVSMIMVGVIVTMGVIMIMMRVIMMIVVMIIMIVVMVRVIVMIMSGLGLGPTFILHQCLEFFAGDLLFRDLGLGHDVIDDLLLEDRAAQFKQRIGVLAVIVEHLALLAGELASPVEKGPLHFIFADADAFPLAQRAEHEA